MTETLTALSACLCGLFPGRETLTRFLAFLKIIVEFLSYVFDFLFAVLIRVHGEAGVEVLLPDYPCLIFRLMSG